MNGGGVGETPLTSILRTVPTETRPHTNSVFGTPHRRTLLPKPRRCHENSEGAGLGCCVNAPCSETGADTAAINER